MRELHQQHTQCKPELIAQAPFVPHIFEDVVQQVTGRAEARVMEHGLEGPNQESFVLVRRALLEQRDLEQREIAVAVPPLRMAAVTSAMLSMVAVSSAVLSMVAVGRALC